MLFAFIRPCRILLAFALGLPAMAAQAQDGLVGSYLAARQASMQSDYRAAAGYYTQALRGDPNNPFLLESAIVAQMALGDLDAALPLAQRLAQAMPDNGVAGIVILAARLKAGDYPAIFAEYEAGRSLNPLVYDLVKGWILLDQGDVSGAFAAFDDVIANPDANVFGAYHKALALASVGDYEGAAELFESEFGENLLQSRRGAFAYAEVLGQLDRFDQALAHLNTSFGSDPDPAVAKLRAQLEEASQPGFSIIASPKDGMADVFFTVATILAAEAGDSFTLIYSRAAEALSPRHTDAILLSAALLERQQQYDLATEAYNLISRDDPAFHQAEIGRAEALRAAGRVEAAIEALTQLSKSNAEIPQVHRALGDLLASEDRYAEAVGAYDAAIEAMPVEDASAWVLYYARGISYERTQRWPEAEADFRKALELSPNQPEVLNYLGYSYLELRINLDEALALIETAVQARPEDGAIVDSYGWALYRLGRFEEAVAPMERAAQLLPLDPIINDHLGDVLWVVSRKTEAEFQWRRALSLEPTETDAERIRRKLEAGLDVVLSEEGAGPLSVANGD
jgi:tetratricopeptide (TPR) repeat protein